MNDIVQVLKCIRHDIKEERHAWMADIDKLWTFTEKYAHQTGELRSKWAATSKPFPWFEMKTTNRKERLIHVVSTRGN